VAKVSDSNQSQDDQSQDSLPENRIPVIRVPARPSDQNPGGSIFGGWIMSYVDIAGSIPALERVRGPVVTRAVDSFEFKKPVFVGDLVSCYAEIISEGRTSMKVKVEVFAERLSKGESSCIKVTEAVLTYVAIDEKRRPKNLPAR
jgi:acyl-CoA thioesterase YciA